MRQQSIAHFDVQIQLLPGTHLQTATVSLWDATLTREGSVRHAKLFCQTVCSSLIALKQRTREQLACFQSTRG